MAFKTLFRVLSANSPTGCSADKQPVTGHGLRARRGAPFAATRLRVLKRTMAAEQMSPVSHLTHVPADPESS